MSVPVVAFIQIARVGLAWGVWSSSPRAVPSMAAVPWVVIKRCMACFSCTWCGVRRRMATIVVILGIIFFQSMVPVGSRHVVAVLLVWFPPRGSW